MLAAHGREQATEDVAQVQVVGRLVEAQAAAVVEVHGELRGVALAQLLRKKQVHMCKSVRECERMYFTFRQLRPLFSQLFGVANMRGCYTYKYRHRLFYKIGVPKSKGFLSFVRGKNWYIQ